MNCKVDYDQKHHLTGHTQISSHTDYHIAAQPLRKALSLAMRDSPKSPSKSAPPISDGSRGGDLDQLRINIAAIYFLKKFFNGIILSLIQLKYSL